MRRVLIIICVILAAVIFAILVVRQNYKNSPDYNYITAKLDIRNENVRIINVGLRKPSLKDKEIDSVEAEYGFRNIYIGYDTTKQIISGINNYNEVTEAFLKLRNGGDWRENYQRKVDSLYKAAFQ